MAISKTYCTLSDMKDIFPNIDEYDNKTPLIGWASETIGSASYYINYDSGYTSNLFKDGLSLSGKQITEADLTTIAEDLDDSDTVITVASGTGIDDEFIKIDDEVIGVTSASTNDLTVIRGMFGTTATTHSNGATVKRVFKISSSSDDSWAYISEADAVIMKSDTDPINHRMESGANWSALTTRVMQNASRYFDSRVDANLPREQWKDREGNFDYLVVRTTALIACAFLIKANSPQSEDLAGLVDEYEFNLSQINDGKAKLAHQNTSDSSKGVVRTVSGPAHSNPLRIVDTRGNYYGTYELYKVYIDTGDGGAIGTAKYSVKSKNSDGLKQQLSVDSEVINGDWQTLGGGLQIRFAGKNDSAEATANDEWEIECHGAFEETENSTHGNTKMTRTDRLYRPFNDYFRKNIDI
jgi:hypothetical protein